VLQQAVDSRLLCQHEHDERRDQDDTRRDANAGDERHDQAGQEPEQPEPEDAQDRDDV